MRRVQIAELKDRLSAHLRAVERGAEVEVTDRSRPIAKIVPVERSAAMPRVLPARRRFSRLKRKRYRPARWAIRSLELLLEERRET